MNSKDNIFKLYESDVLSQATGDTLRPGGFFLTDLGVKHCGFHSGDRVLDVGCGNGATVEHLVIHYQLQAIGIDPSDMLLKNGREKNQNLNLIQGRGEDLPFPVNYMDGVLAECTLSVMKDLDQVLSEIHRVLKPGGWFVVNDVYARNPEGLKTLQKLNLDSCIRRALPREELINKLKKYGFCIDSWNDHTNLLTQLMVNIIMAHGSMANFWLMSSACTVDPALAQAAVKQAKMGYFQLTARKVSG